MVPLGAVGDVRRSQRAADPQPLQHVSGGRHPGTPGREQLPAGHRPHATTGRQGVAPLHACEWTEMAYLELQAGHTAMYSSASPSSWCSSCWPRSTRAGRLPLGRDPGRSHVPLERGHRRLGGARVSFQFSGRGVKIRLGPLPTRSAPTNARWTSTSSPRSASSCWSGGKQECDADCGVRQAQRRGGTPRREAACRPANSACGRS